MPRKSREISSIGIYHVILRSVNQQQIFEEKSDYNKFLLCLSDCKSKYELKIYAYCLMSNHIHLIIEAPITGLSTAMQSFCGRFVLSYNKKYDRSGHLFQARFWSRPIVNRRQLLRTVCYIHENPVKAGMTRYASEYVWSSCKAYLGSEDQLVDVEEMMGKFESQEVVREYFSKYEIQEEDVLQMEDEAGKKTIILENAMNTFRRITACKSPSDFQKLPKIQRHEFIRELHREHLTQKQIVRFTGTSRTTVYRALNPVGYEK